MKARLEFNLPEEREEFENAVNASKYKDQLDEVWQQCYRPAFKHGFSNDELNKLLENEEVYRAIEILSEIFLKIRND